MHREIMEYQKIMKFFVNITDNPSKRKTNNWVLVNGDANKTYDLGTEVRSKTTLLKSIFLTTVHTYFWL